MTESAQMELVIIIFTGYPLQIVVSVLASFQPKEGHTDAFGKESAERNCRQWPRR